MIGVDARKAVDSVDHNYMQGVLEAYYPIKYSLQWFLPKPPHGGFGNFFHWYLCKNRYGVPSLKMLRKVTQKKLCLFKFFLIARSCFGV